MELKSSFLKYYLFIALFFGILSFLDNILTILKLTNNSYINILTIVFFLFFFFNIMAIPLFHHYHAQRIAYVLPFYHIISYIILLALSSILTVKALILGGGWILLIMIGTITSLFEIIFSLYLLKKFKFV